MNLESISHPETQDPILALGSRLAVIRAESRMTQAEFAEELGISARAYHLYECGKRSMPAKTLMDISKLHDVDMNWLLRGLGTSKLDDHSAEIREFIFSLDKYLDRTETKLPSENLAALISSAINRLLKGEKIDIESVHLAVDTFRTQP